MSEQFVGEIRLFAGSFVPAGWALCDGQKIAIRDNPQLFSILQTRFGGDGRTTFALPDLSRRVGLHRGKGPRLSDRPLGSSGGDANVALTLNELPSHAHTPMASSATGGVGAPKDRIWARTQSSLYKGLPPTVVLRGDALSPEGGSKAHNNLQPYLVVRYIIAVNGTYPVRG